MVALIAYLAIGALVVISISIVRRQTPGDPDPIRDALASLVPERGSPVRRMIVGTVAPAVATIVSVVAWPLAIWLRAKGAASRETALAGGGPGPLVVEPAHLQARTSVREVERLERISDPLHAVPDVPFGFLHPAWRRFVELLADDDELWSFSARWRDAWTVELHQGYAILRGGEVRAYFVSSRGTPGTGARGQ